MSGKMRHWAQRGLIAAGILLSAISAPRADVDAQGPGWGAGFRTCPGASARRPELFKAANPIDSDVIRASGIIKCVDEGSAYLYTVDFVNFSLNPAGSWTTAHLEWFGAAVQRAGPDGSNDFVYDEARPIKVQIVAGVKRIAVTNLSFRIPKSVLEQARGFGFYIVGGGILWSIFFL
jgi:hypothetical protein